MVRIPWPSGWTLTYVASGSYFSLMKAVGLKVLKNRLSEYVRMAANGEIILVTDRDKVVAELVPPREERSTDLADALLADAVRKGWVKPPALPQGSPPPRRPVAKFKLIMRELQSDREDR